MSIGKERYTRNVIYVGGAPALKPGHGMMFLLSDDQMMFYYEYVAPESNGELRDMFMQDVMTHCMTGNGKMRISFVFATNIIHSLTRIVNPMFLGMDEEMEPLAEEGGAEDAYGEETDEEGSFTEEGTWDDGYDIPDDAPMTVTPLAGTENVIHEAVGSVESIADTPIPFELWLFSIKKLGQNFASASHNFELRSEEEKEALRQEYNQTFGF